MAEHTCPVWIGYLLASPIRKLFQNPKKILSPYVIPGQTVVDIGPGMGFFTLPMAEFVKPSGKVYSVDIQKDMLEKLLDRAKEKNLDKYIYTIQCDASSLCLNKIEGTIDFVLMMAVLHEIGNPKQALEEVFEKLKPGGLVLLSEPKGHVKKDDFEKTLEMIEQIGFKLEACPDIPKSLSVLFSKPK